MTENKPVLPKDAAGAVKQMIKLIEQLIAVMDREAMALARRDSIAFAAAQEDKGRFSEDYARASAEFGERLQEFRAVDAGLVDRLGARQEELKAKMQDSTRAMERLQAKSGTK